MNRPSAELLAKAEELVRRNALPGSLTQQILDGRWGEESIKATFYFKAVELQRKIDMTYTPFQPKDKGKKPPKKK